ncbi:MAG: GlsB/YeaQ/YmgE family stress response membrane protein [Chloroflexia bacterium]|nr:GlsB/YeaQ/YmgE family stress response membrane protein [Chloroflexia bacterium]
MNFLAWIIVGIVAGWLAGLITRTDRSIWGDLVLGLVGAFIAGLIVDGAVGGDAGLWSSIIAATIAAVILVLIKNMIMGRRSA